MQLSMLVMNRDISGDEDREAIRRFMKDNKLKDHPWSLKAGVSNGTLRKFLKGETESLKYKTLSKFATAANTSPQALLRKTGVPMVKVLGYMKNQEVVFYSDNIKREVPSRRPDMDNEQLYVIIAEDTSMGVPVGTELYISEERKAPEDLVGKYCLITTAENKSYIRNIDKGNKPKTYMLWSINSSPLHDIKLKYAAKVLTFELPR